MNEIEMSMEVLVDHYMTGSGNERRRYLLNYINHGMWIWQDLLLHTIPQYKQKLITVDKTKDPYEVILPKDCMLFISASYVNRSKEVRQMAYKNDMPIPLLQSYQNNGVCKSCNSEDVAAKINNLKVVLSDVVVDGKAYVAKEYTKVLANGDLVLITQVPLKDYTSPTEYTIRTHTTQSVLCNLEKKPCGCVALTTANVTNINMYCGYVVPVVDNPHGSVQRPYDGYGYIRKEGNKLYLQGNVPDCVIVTYRTNGLCGAEEMMVPIEAANTVMFGINWRAKALSPNSGRLDARESKRNYEMEKDKLLELQYPMSASEFMDTQMILPKWGSMQDVDRNPLPMFENEKKAIERKAAADAAADAAIAPPADTPANDEIHIGSAPPANPDLNDIWIQV